VGTWSLYWAQNVIEDGEAPPTANAVVQFTAPKPGQKITFQGLTTAPNFTMNNGSPNSGWLIRGQGAPLAASVGATFYPGPSSVWRTRLIFRVVRAAWITGLMQRANKSPVMHNSGE
jgi:hypothetical protein